MKGMAWKFQKKKSRFVFIFELEKHGVLRRSRPWSAGQCEEEHVTQSWGLTAMKIASVPKHVFRFNIGPTEPHQGFHGTWDDDPQMSAATSVSFLVLKISHRGHSSEGGPRFPSPQSLGPVPEVTVNMGQSVPSLGLCHVLPRGRADVRTSARYSVFSVLPSFLTVGLVLCQKYFQSPDIKYIVRLSHWT